MIPIDPPFTITNRLAPVLDGNNHHSHLNITVRPSVRLGWFAGRHPTEEICTCVRFIYSRNGKDGGRQLAATIEEQQTMIRHSTGRYGDLRQWAESEVSACHFFGNARAEMAKSNCRVSFERLPKPNPKQIEWPAVEDLLPGRCVNKRRWQLGLCTAKK